MLRRFQLLQRLLRDLGIDERRVRLEWISAAEGEKVKTVINEMTAQLTALGPLGLPQKFAEWDQEVIALAREARQPDAPRQSARRPESTHAEVAHA